MPCKTPHTQTNGVIRHVNAVTPIDSFFNAYTLDSGETYRERTAKLLDLRVGSIATKHVISVETDTPVERACRILADSRIKKLPVT